MTAFGERLADRVRAVGNFGCVGLDPFLDRVPGVARGMSADEAAAAVGRFCRTVIEVVAPLVPVVKPQSALFEQLGAPGLAVLADVVHQARDAGLVVIVDGKRGDIGSTAEAYAVAQLDDVGPLGADAATVSPYLGPESLMPYERRLPAGKGLFVLVRTSNPGAGPWQVDTGIAEAVAAHVAARCLPAGGADSAALGSVGAVVAATLPAAEVAHWRQRMPNSWFLVPGFGAQGAGPAEVRPHVRADGLGALISSSREVLFGSGPPDDAADPGRVADRVAERARAFVAAIRTISA
ncbi:MAG: orotidine-5'-phosphate decarboxylase [Myxococcota bacterium]